METLYQYLQRIGLFDYEVSPEVLAEAKKQYRKEYQKEYQKQFRLKNIRKDIYFTPKEFKHLSSIARKQNKSIPKLCKELIFAYLQKLYVLPDDETVRQLELYLRGATNNLNQTVRYIHQRKELTLDDFAYLRNQVDTIENKVSQLLRSPLDLEKYLEDKIEHDPQLIYLLEYLINKHYNR